jgi:hypothetical protein
VQVLAPNGSESLTQTTTIRWQASDLDGDPLLYIVQYSPDLGATWRALATNVPTVTLTVDTAALPGSSQGLVRVIATDGLNTGMDQSDAAFTVPTHPPSPYIATPLPGTRLPLGAAIYLSGGATDAEDGPLDGLALTWWSDRDGFLGDGPDLPAPALSPGRHLITLRATDSDDQIGETAVEVFLQPPVYLPLVMKASM